MNQAQAIANGPVSIPSIKQEIRIGSALKALAALVARAVFYFFAAFLNFVSCSAFTSFAKSQREKFLAASQALTNALKPSADPIVRENQIRYGVNNIARRLEKQWTDTQVQRDKQVDNPNFQFLAADAPFLENGEAIDFDENFSVAVCSAIGPRPTLEDEHIATSFRVEIGQTSYPVQLFGVFDGHGGTAAARYVKEHIQEKLTATLQEFNRGQLTDEGIWNALKLVCVRLNGDFKQALPRDLSGTTAAIALILNGEIWCANVGDSRAIFAGWEGEHCQLTEDAKPEASKYRRGIENRGGILERVQGIFRINGNLAVARAVGDQLVGDGVSARAKITKRDLPPSGGHLILGCDGIWDVASTRQAAAAIQAHANQSTVQLACNLAYSALQAGSTDNVTAMVVRLQPRVA